MDFLEIFFSLYISQILLLASAHFCILVYLLLLEGSGWVVGGGRRGGGWIESSYRGYLHTQTGGMDTLEYRTCISCVSRNNSGCFELKCDMHGVDVACSWRSGPPFHAHHHGKIMAAHPFSLLQLSRARRLSGSSLYSRPLCSYSYPRLLLHLCSFVLLVFIRGEREEVARVKQLE